MAKEYKYKDVVLIEKGTARTTCDGCYFLTQEGDCLACKITEHLTFPFCKDFIFIEKPKP